MEDVNNVIMDISSIVNIIASSTLTSSSPLTHSAPNGPTRGASNALKGLFITRWESAKLLIVTVILGMEKLEFAILAIKVMT